MMGNPMFCFVAGTTVLTTLGKKAIENIQVGDVIPCVDHITGESAEKKVISTTVNKVTRLIELDIDGEVIQCTETHPFQVKGRGWVNASELAPNDIVYTKDWGAATVKSVKLLELDEPVEVFNFEVEDCHTYFVGEFNVLVHNDCPHKRVAGDKNGLNAKVAIGGDKNHSYTPHAHIFFKDEKIGTVNKSAQIIMENFGKIKGVPDFVRKNADKIIAGIDEWWYYGRK